MEIFVIVGALVSVVVYVMGMVCYVLELEFMRRRKGELMLSAIIAVIFVVALWGL
jgi:hypothetical protein